MSIQLAQRSPRQIAWGRLKRNKVAMVSAVIALFFVLIAFLAPAITGLFGVDNTHLYLDKLNDGLPRGFGGGMSLSHPLGLEPGAGRDLMALLLYGSRISFSIAIITAFTYISIGLIFGITAAYLGGFVDSLLGRVADFLLAFPTTFMFVALSLPLTMRVEATGLAKDNGARIVVMVLILTIFSWPSFFRVTRSQVLSLREREFVLAARAIGAPRWRIIFKEFLPNLWPLAIIYLSISLPGYLAAEAVFSFLGVGVQAPSSTWGLVLNDAASYWQRDPAYLIIPAGMVVVVVLALNLFGDGLRDALDPKSDR